MIVDSSAIIAVLLGEPGNEEFAAAIASADSLRISAGTLLETAIVLDGPRNPVVSARLEELLERAGFTVEPFTPAQARIARQAHRDFGRGSGHAARLNLGDSFAYALAKDLGEPLLFKGNDFSHTDVPSALPTDDSEP